MKNHTILFAAAATAMLAIAPLASAQVTATTATTSTTFTPGTISEFSPDTIVIRSETAPAPIRYSYTKTTTYVDEEGTPVSMDLVKSGLPVKVYYVKEGDRMIANRVVVSRKSSTTTTGSGAAVIEKKSTTLSPAPATAVEKKSTTTTTTTK